MSSGKWENWADISKEQNPAASESRGTERGGDEGSETVDDIRSKIRSLDVKDLKRDKIKSKIKATAEEPKKINKAKNRGFEVEIFGKRSAHNAPMEED